MLTKPKSPCSSPTFRCSSPKARRSSPPIPDLEVTQPAAEEFDHEIAKIYSEEATELLEAAEISLEAWNHDRRDKQRVAELQRQLHTLKGGARMAGIKAMGDLSHELETLVIKIDSGAVPADDHAHAVMQASLDELARMRDGVSAGSLPAAADALLAQIRTLASGARQAPAVAVPMVEAPALEAPAAEADAPSAPEPIAALLVEAPPAEEAANSGRFLRIPAAPEHPAAPAAAEDSVSNLEVSGAPVLPGRESAPAERVEMARVDADLLDTMLNNAGEVSIFRARLDQQVNSIDFNLAELARTVTRLKEQLRGLEMETEAQVLNRHHDEDPRRNDFDPLELDRYSAIQQFSRALAETSGDVASIQGLLETLDARGSESADAAGARHHRAAEQPDAHAHGPVPEARAAPDAPGAPGRQRHRQARRTGGARRLGGAGSPDARAHGGAVGAHAAQRGRARHRAT